MWMLLGGGGGGVLSVGESSKAGAYLSSQPNNILQSPEASGLNRPILAIHYRRLRCDRYVVSVR